MNSKPKHIGGGVTAPAGYLAAGIHCGIKKKQAKDIAVVISETEAAAAGMFTTNLMQAAPVVLSRKHIGTGRAQAIAINSGNANACSGDAGMIDALEMARVLAETTGTTADNVLIASTGLIGVPLPMDKVVEGIKDAVACVSKDGGNDAAEAIMTTDTVPKQTAVELTIAGKMVRVAGMAKGAGMISPNMATMIAVVTTDAGVPHDLLTEILRAAVNDSFNCITVDGDMSTNDTVFALANGLSGVYIGKRDAAYRELLGAFKSVTYELAEKIIDDAEGATKRVVIDVKGAADDADARRIGLAVANSILVKCALFGEDANWGRIAAAIGASGADIDPNDLDLLLGAELIFSKGGGVVFCAGGVEKAMKGRTIPVTIDARRGSGTARILTTDLSTEYVKINAHYRT